MTMLWSDGLDLYGSSADLALNYISSNFSAIKFSTTGGRFGGGAVSSQYNFSTGSYNIARLLGSSNANMWTSFAADFISGTTQDSDLVGWGAGSTNNGGQETKLKYTPTTGVWTFYRVSTGVAIISATYPVAYGWHWIDFRSTYNASTGSAELWVDDVQVFSGTGLNTTDNTGLTGWTSVIIFGNSTWMIDDLFVYTPGTRLGDSRIETEVPTSDASPNQGTPSTGTSHYAVVDEAHIDTTDYITMSNTSGYKEVFGVSSLVSTPVSVWSVKVVLVAQKSDAGSFLIEPLVISGGTEGDGASTQVLTSYGTIQTVYETNPHTSAAWVYTDVNAMDVGFKVP